MKFVTSLFAAAVLSAAPAQANIQEGISRSEIGSNYVLRGSELIKNGNITSGCVLLNKGANELAIASAFFPEQWQQQEVLNTYYSVKATIRNRC
jgi:hypothetical protein